MGPGTRPRKPLASYKRGELALVILLCAVAGVLVVSVAVAPGLTHVMRLFRPRNNRERLKIRRAVDFLAKKGMITHSKNGSIQATAAGSLRAAYETLSIPSTPWDRKWRLVMFDIPEKKRGVRISLNRKLLDMGMRHVQDSVFISPYPCEKEIALAVRFLRADSYVYMATAEALSGEERFKKEFGIQ